MENKTTPSENIEETTEKEEVNPHIDKKESKKEEKLSVKLEKENEALKNELEEQKDKYLRVVAEYENYRKRSQKEKCDSYTEAYTKAITYFLPLIDTIERAQEFVKDDDSFKAIIKQLSDILLSLDVKAIESDGMNFDPNFHNAIMHEEDENYSENVIIQTLQKGYTLNDKVIRHAMVKVVN